MAVDSSGESRLSMFAEKRAQVEKAASSFMAANSVPEVPAAVVQDGELVWSEGFEMADLENFVPATSSTPFRLGSISKPITATAILHRAGIVVLTERLFLWLPTAMSQRKRPRARSRSSRWSCLFSENALMGIAFT